MNSYFFLEHSSASLQIAAGLLGLVIGSFLNVVIARVPRMMEQAWKAEARELLDLAPDAAPQQKLSLLSPASSCPHCGAKIAPWHNIPLVSWLLLKGRCAGCSQAISLQYPLVEGLTAVASAVCAWRFGWSWELVAALLLTWSLLALIVIDLQTMLLPDDITLPLLWLGLLFATRPVFAELDDAVIGAAAGYLSLWTLFQLFKLLTGKEGMGYGDFKLFAALGAWLGWQALPTIILLSSVVGAVVGIGLMATRRLEQGVAIPFGPYLAGAGWIALLWGEELKLFYFHATGMR